MSWIQGYVLIEGLKHQIWGSYENVLDSGVCPDRGILTTHFSHHLCRLSSAFNQMKNIALTLLEVEVLVKVKLIVLQWK